VDGQAAVDGDGSSPSENSMRAARRGESRLKRPGRECVRTSTIGSTSSRSRVVQTPSRLLKFAEMTHRIQVPRSAAGRFWSSVRRFEGARGSIRRFHRSIEGICCTSLRCHMRQPTQYSSDSHDVARGHG
jgi:hypothetical protein